MNLIKSTVTGQYLCGFADSGTRSSRGVHWVPVFGDKAAAQDSKAAASVEALAKCHLAGVLAVEVEFQQ
jgi:hypothetical protein